MSHGRFKSPIEGALTGIKDRFGPQKLAGELTDEVRADGRRILITGGSSGVGFAAAVELASRGAHVITVSRSGIPEKGEEIKRLADSERVEMLRCDLSDLTQVHELADTLRDRGERIDVLLDNAGVATPRAKQTPQGLDAMFVTNFLAKFVLSHRLLTDNVIVNETFGAGPSLPEAERPRIIFVSSDSHRGASAIDWEEFGRYYEYGVNKGIHNYSYFKLVLNTFGAELARRLESDGQIDVATHVMCPGPVNSNIARDAPAWLGLILRGIFTLAFRAPAVAAKPAALLAAHEDFGRSTGRYLHMFNEKRMDEKCYGAAAGAELWDRSVKLLSSLNAWPGAARHDL